MLKLMLTCSFCLLAVGTFAQNYRWQQKVDYRMQIHLDVETHQFAGTQTLFYFNQSPDTLSKVFFHLYFNAFQPGSMMDVRSQTILDPDSRIGNRIGALQPDEVGMLKVTSLMQDGLPVSLFHDGTILEVTLVNPLLPNEVALFEMAFEGQVPIQIRRSGRDNAEGIAYSMAQWYPKICEYDEQGWHSNPYVGREFYGVWGNYDVRISLNSSYVVAATGFLQNASDIGYGYATPVRHKKNGELTWHFIARNVHDFVWAADPDYTHTQTKTSDSTEIHFFYQETNRNRDAWRELPSIISKAWPLIIERFGPYPYGKFSFIQGGDGAMEYPMATLMNGDRTIGGLIGSAIHELMHSWYHMMLATNESLYAWMDEGFTTYATTIITNELRKDGSIPGEYTTMPFADLYNGYRNLIKSGREEPLSTHADHFTTNYGYGISAYTKGAVFLKQLEYIVGNQSFDHALIEYYYKWRYHHPNPNDFIRVFEKISDLELDWYREYFVNSTKFIEYKIERIESQDQQTLVTLARLGQMPMPIDLQVIYKDESTTWHTIPLKMMRGEKKSDFGHDFKVEPDWPWTNPTYMLLIDHPIEEIKAVKIDPTLRLADFDLTNNMMQPTDN